MQTEKTAKQYGLNTKIMQIYQDTDSGRVQDDRYPAKKMPFDENGDSDVYNTQYNLRNHGRFPERSDH